MAALGVVPDGVVSAHADPIWDWPVLPLLLRQLLLYHESLVRRLPDSSTFTHTHKKNAFLASELNGKSMHQEWQGVPWLNSGSG